MFGGNTKLAEINEKNSDTLEIPFTVPQGGSLVDIRITNNSEKSKVLIDNAKIIDGKTGKSVKNVKLQYKFIPNSVASRFENLMISRSFIQRQIYLNDGFQMFKDNWLIGAGGGHGRALFLHTSPTVLVHAIPCIFSAGCGRDRHNWVDSPDNAAVINCCTVYYGI